MEGGFLSARRSKGYPYDRRIGREVLEIVSLDYEGNTFSAKSERQEP